jgi:hypothetical protein
MTTSVAELYHVENSGNRPAGKGNLPRLVVMTSSLLTDRMFLHTGLLDALSENFSVEVWATSARNPRLRQLWNSAEAVVEEFPEVHPFKEFPHNQLRRLNESVWDLYRRPPSRLSAARYVRKKNLQTYLRSFRMLTRVTELLARALARVKVERSLEDRLEKMLLAYPRSQEALERLTANPPDVLLTTGPFQFEQPAVVAVAKNLGIPTLALIPSWDNLSTKGRMVFKYDGYLVWSEQAREELHYFYPYTLRTPIYPVGAPQFDIFFLERFRQTREEFCATQGLRPDRPIIVYALGSPNLLSEHYGAVEMAERVASGALGDVQLIVRPHPIHDNAEMTELFRRFPSRVVLQQTAEAGTALTARSQDEQQIVEWVNTFHHANVVVNLSSTVTVDAAIFDRPVVNLDYDPEPGEPNRALVHDINHLWTHFKPIAESGGVWLVKNPEEIFEAVRTYLQHPDLHREQRKWIAEYVCGYVDGGCAQRMAQAILDFVQSHVKGASKV